MFLVYKNLNYHNAILGEKKVLTDTMLIQILLTARLAKSRYNMDTRCSIRLKIFVNNIQRWALLICQVTKIKWYLVNVMNVDV